MASSSSSSPEMLGAKSDDHFSYKHATHDEVLEDLSSRFILNLPDDELSSLERICFQVEQAHWFYEDFIREENPKLPSLPLKKFSAMLFHACPLLHQWSHDHEQAFNTFMQYKTRVPVCGAIMLNDTWEKCLLVKGWKSSSGWGFPKGKINEVEPPTSCAIREVLEETGYNLAGQINPEDVIELSIKEQKISLFIVPGVPEDYPFKTKTRKEISKIEWFQLTELPTWKRNKTAAGRFYLISPFIGPLKAFINDRKPRFTARKSPRTKKSPITQRKQPYFKNSQDVKHESSSQSSSAENGEPQTPSPYYAEAHPTSIPHIATTESRQSDIPLDPHFAQLLSALAISASTSSATKLADHESTPPSNMDMARIDPSSKELMAPIEVSPSSNKIIPVDPPVADRPFISSPVSVNAAESQTTLAHSAAPVNLAVTTFRRGKQAFDDKRSDYPQSPSPLESQFCKAAINTPGGSIGLTTSYRSISSHETPSSADLLPYLPRPSSLVTPSADRIKQIALLEAASAESARLMYAYKTAATKGVPINVQDNFKQHGPSDLGAAAPITPHFSNTHSNNVNSPLDSQWDQHDVLYASHPAASPGTTTIQSVRTNASTLMNGSSPIRSRTSEACSRGESTTFHLPSSVSMNQSQVSTLVHGSHNTPSSPYFPGQRIQMAGPHYTPAVLPTSNIFHPKPMQEGIPPSNRFSRTSSHARSPPTQRLSHHPLNNTLLSILNNPRSPSRANITPYMTISGGGA